MEYDFDRSYPSPEQQLLWRLDDLNSRLEELIEANAPYGRCTRLTENDFRYAIPECFETILDVKIAIKTAIDDLKCKYEIDILEESDDSSRGLDEKAKEQFSSFDIIQLQSLPEPQKVA